MIDYKTAWKQIANDKAITPRLTAQYCLIKAAKAKSNQKLEIAQALLRRAFPPITKPSKLANGRTTYDTLYHSLLLPKSIILDQNIEDILTEEEYKTVIDLSVQIRKTDILANEPEYLFIFVRQDIEPEYQAVQGMHVAYKAGRVFESNPNETHFVLVGVPDGQALEEADNLLQSKNLATVIFREPDIGNLVTAIASEPMKAHRKNFLKNYKLLVF